jgi:hypothetical protein
MSLTRSVSIQYALGDRLKSFWLLFLIILNTVTVFPKCVQSTYSCSKEISPYSCLISQSYDVYAFVVLIKFKFFSYIIIHNATSSIKLVLKATFMQRILGIISNYFI